MVSISSYHIANAAYHQQQFDSDDGLLAKGYIITSLSVYRQGNNLRYTTIWTHQKGPKWQGFHGLNSGEYQTFFDTWYKKGYAPIGSVETIIANSLLYYNIEQTVQIR